MKSTSRERLLEAAATLTYHDGVTIGVDALCKAAGVSKRSMYQLFHSKDDLLAASLEERTAPFVATLLDVCMALPADRLARRPVRPYAESRSLRPHPPRRRNHRRRAPAAAGLEPGPRLRHPR